MKKFFAMILSCALLVTLAACGSMNSTSSEKSTGSQTREQSSQPSEEFSTAFSTSEGTPDTTPESMPEPEPGANALVIYFSWSGNTETIAGEIASQTGADTFQLEPATAYSTDYNTVLDEAQAEQRADARPEIVGSIENFDSYDVIYLGFPNWWGDMPMIAPFVSSGGSGFSDALSAIASAEPGATITDGLSLSSSASQTPGGAVADWLADIGFAE